jgi:hypothetical protein
MFTGDVVCRPIKRDEAEGGLIDAIAEDGAPDAGPVVVVFVVVGVIDRAAVVQRGYEPDVFLRATGADAAGTRRIGVPVPGVVRGRRSGRRACRRRARPQVVTKGRRLPLGR